MFGWLKRHVENTVKYETERFTMSLKGADVDVLNMVCGTAMLWATFYKAKGYDFYEMEDWIGKKEHMMFPTQLVSHIKTLQEQKTFSSVPGVVVWLSSLRALRHPELRIYGRQIWQELQNCTFEAENISIELSAHMGLKNSICNRLRVPTGLEPLSR
jgi:hypothetical protein